MRVIEEGRRRRHLVTGLSTSTRRWRTSPPPSDPDVVEDLGEDELRLAAKTRLFMLSRLSPRKPPAPTRRRKTRSACSRNAAVARRDWPWPIIKPRAPCRCAIRWRTASPRWSVDHVQQLAGAGPAATIHGRF